MKGLPEDVFESLDGLGSCTVSALGYLWVCSSSQPPAAYFDSTWFKGSTLMMHAEGNLYL